MTRALQDTLRNLPSVDAVLKHPAAVDLTERFGRGRLADAIRLQLDAIRADLLAATLPSPEPSTQHPKATLDAATILTSVEKTLNAQQQPRLKRVVNATGIVLHTGLGRAVMPPDAATALADLTGCCNIQIDLTTGERVKREHCIRDLLCELTGAEDALLVNNNAAATLLVLKALAEDKEVIVSRGELIEIGGSFRLPDIMSQSGALLREVGATNKTHARDYANAIEDNTAILLKVHKSNYEITGFSKEVGIAEIAEIGKAHQIPVVDDLGCGALLGLEQFGLAHEMTVSESLKAGADIALFSSDKLIGGPQGGLIVGRKELIERIRKHPLYRAFRVGKMTLAALEATLRLFRSPETISKSHPVYGMLAKTPDSIKEQATQTAERIAADHPDWAITIEKTAARLGGGALPGSELPSYAIQIIPEVLSANALALQLRQATVPIIPRIKDTAVLIDMRTVMDNETDDVVNACRSIT